MTPAVEVSVPDHGVIRVEPGEIVGLFADDVTGTRIADALLAPCAGADGVGVLLDQYPAAQVDHAIYRSRVVVAPHAVMLFSGTIADNLDVAAASPEVRAAALRAAACEDFATDARAVGEMGSQLSGGQRQRVALARALAADAPVLVLHNPTTAVDSVTEAVIADRLSELRRGRSTLLITSSPVLFGVCDRVVKLHPGRVEACAEQERVEVSTR